MKRNIKDSTENAQTTTFAKAKNLQCVGLMIPKDKKWQNNYKREVSGVVFDLCYLKAEE